MIPAVKSSTPTFREFTPEHIPFQYRVVYDIKQRFEYDEGPQFVLLSGSVGSAKSLLIAYLVIAHCLEFNGSCALVARKGMPDLKDTIWLKIEQMLDGSFIEGVDYIKNDTRTEITFIKTGSRIITRSWHDKKYKKFRSIEVSFIAIEEMTENNDQDKEAFIEMLARIGRLPHVPENVVIGATNPDDPSHWVYEFFIKGSKRSTTCDYYAFKPPNVHTYYSRTHDNPFLPSWYIEQLKDKYDSKMQRRLLFGEWLYISTDVIYYQYNPEIHTRLKNSKYDPDLAIRLTFDFNIRKGKPMSSASFQFNPRIRKFCFYDEVAVEGARTGDALEEWAGKGVFDHPDITDIVVHGDAAGKHRDSRGSKTDYDIIERFIVNYVRKDKKKLKCYIEVPKSNPRLRDRHNIANGQLEKKRVIIDERCEYVDKGLSNARLKENAGYIEDQSVEGQDMSTAVTYGIYYVIEYGDDYIDEQPITFS
jgi:hypothetical protein